MIRQIGKYTVIRRLGRGGMGTVYKALVPVIDKVVAIKLLQPGELLEDMLGLPKLEEMFTFEACTMAAFNQPFLVTAHDFGRDAEGRLFFVMEHICNNLGAMMGENFVLEEPSRIIRAEQVLHYGLQILTALDFLHCSQIVHRDIKPQNILVTDADTIKICDFGMALVRGVSFSGPGNMQVGSPYYTPPEQRTHPREVDGRADLYSVGVMLYRMLTGQLPGMQNLSLSLVNPRYDQAWDGFFARALRWKPADRFQNALEMRAALEQLRVGPPTPSGYCELQPAGTQSVALRSQPVNVCGARAQSTFAVSARFRPLVPVCGPLAIQGEVARDPATNLVWMRTASPLPMTFAAATAYVAALNAQSACGVSCWRVPTVNELLSLLDDGDVRRFSEHSGSSVPWFWSCDQHGFHESWYVNMDMGYAGVQDVNCLNFVRAVACDGQA